MAVVKLRKEKRTMSFLLMICVMVFIISAVFLYFSIQKDELGGSFITAMLLFISGYGLIVFIARMVKYKFITKLQSSIINEGFREFSALASLYGKGTETIRKNVEFLINNGYLAGFEIYGDKVINPHEEETKLQAMKQAYYEKQLNDAKKKETPKPARKKQIESEKCPNCGAKVTFEDDSATCPYCGNSLKKA